MKILKLMMVLVGFLALALAGVNSVEAATSHPAEIGSVKSASGKAPRMKMTTDIPESIMMPDKIETRIGTLELFDGFPNDETVMKVRFSIITLLNSVCNT